VEEINFMFFWLLMKQSQISNLKSQISNFK